VGMRGKELELLGEEDDEEAIIEEISEEEQHG
jgi:hypothetical protein